MSADLVLNQVSEEQELRKRRDELAALETLLSQRGSELSKLQSDLLAFESRYLSIVGSLYDQLAEIEKEIARIQGLEFKDDVDSGSLADDVVGCGQNRFYSERLKKLYREVARKFHPDLVQCEQERHHRHLLMVEVNRAYETGAEERLQELLEAGASIEEVAGRGAMSAEMILLVRKLTEAKERLIAIETSIGEITAAESFKLKRRVENAEAIGVDLFADLVSQVERQIRKARNRLEHLRSAM